MLQVHPIIQSNYKIWNGSGGIYIMNIGSLQFILIWKKYYHLGNINGSGTEWLTLVWMKQRWLRKFIKEIQKIEEKSEVLVLDDWMMQRMIYESWRQQANIKENGDLSQMRQRMYDTCKTQK
jgi:hypothetical protein